MKAFKIIPRRRIILIFEIFYEAVFMLALTPLVILLGGVFQTWYEWKDAIRNWKREWSQ
jgi:hypothetical protein